MLFLGQIILDFLLPKIQFQLECGESFLPKLTSIVLQSIENIFLKAHRLMKALNLSLTTSLTEYFSKKGLLHSDPAILEAFMSLTVFL